MIVRGSALKLHIDCLYPYNNGSGPGHFGFLFSVEALQLIPSVRTNLRSRCSAECDG